jgi:hypothetical protein
MFEDSIRIRLKGMCDNETQITQASDDDVMIITTCAYKIM